MKISTAYFVFLLNSHRNKNTGHQGQNEGKPGQIVKWIPKVSNLRQDLGLRSNKEVLLKHQEHVVKELVDVIRNNN